MSNLTGVLQQIADVTSEDIACTLAKEVGGTMMFVPRHPKPHSELSKIIGLENAQAISRYIGWGDILIPAGNFRGLGARKKTIEQLCGQGLSTQKIARMADCHERTVRRTKEKIRNDALQLRLPGM